MIVTMIAIAVGAVFLSTVYGVAIVLVNRVIPGRRPTMQ